jgi:hypothetical protein
MGIFAILDICLELTDGDFPRNRFELRPHIQPFAIKCAVLERS